MSNRTCNQPECESPSIALEMCTKHYQRFKKTGTAKKPKPRLCSVQGCDRKHRGRGYCRLHLERIKRSGSPNIQKPSKKYCSVEGCPLPFYGKGYCNKHWQQSRNGLPPSAERDQNKLYSPVNCLSCGAKHDGASGLMEFCTRSCYYRWYRAEDKNSVASKSCVDCGEVFDLLARSPSGRRTKTSSIRCVECRAEPWGGWCMTADEVASRDGWVCAIGGEKIDPANRFPHPDSGTVDHIIPRSRGGKDVPDNVQLACFRHNRWKSDKMPAELADLQVP